MVIFVEPDPEKIKMSHAAKVRDEIDFFSNLTQSHLLYVAKVLTSIGSAGDDAAMFAQRYAGNAEAYLQMRFKMCACGTMHDTDAELAGFLGAQPPTGDDS